LVVSNRAKINGIKVGSAPISVLNGQYAINCKKFTARSGTIKNGQSVCVRHRAAAKRKAATTTTLTVGGAAVVFTSTTR
jgi:hypothetical protein